MLCLEKAASAPSAVLCLAKVVRFRLPDIIVGSEEEGVQLRLLLHHMATRPNHFQEKFVNAS